MALTQVVPQDIEKSSHYVHFGVKTYRKLPDSIRFSTTVITLPEVTHRNFTRGDWPHHSSGCGFRLHVSYLFLEFPLLLLFFEAGQFSKGLLQLPLCVIQFFP